MHRICGLPQIRKLFEDDNAHENKQDPGKKVHLDVFEVYDKFLSKVS